MSNESSALIFFFFAAVKYESFSGALIGEVGHAAHLPDQSAQCQRKNQLGSE